MACLSRVADGGDGGVKFVCLTENADDVLHALAEGELGAGA